jgi:O-acetyl-ADP-ribose deacetylase (regulator of RNase III)
MCEAFHQHPDGLPRVRVICGRFEDLEPYDGFVTAGNAFGIMTAGIDAAVIRRFGDPLMHAVQHRIMDQFFGEQPVGTAFVIPTGDPTLPFLVHAPTMRVPGGIDGTDKVYAATWAALLAIQAHNQSSDQRIEVVAFPAMGTGFGGVSFSEAARQMAVAYRHLLEPPHRLDWDPDLFLKPPAKSDGWGAGFDLGERATVSYLLCANLSAVSNVNCPTTATNGS